MKFMLGWGVGTFLTIYLVFYAIGAGCEADGMYDRGGSLLPSLHITCKVMEK